MCESCSVLREKVLFLELDLLRALHYIVVSQFEDAFEYSLNSSTAARNLRALSFILVDKYIQNKKIVMERILEGLRIETVEKSKIADCKCWMMDEELSAIKEYMYNNGVSVLVYHDNDIKPYIDPFEKIQECVVMIHCFKDIHFSGTRPIQCNQTIQDECNRLFSSYDMTFDFESFLNANFEIVHTSSDGNCGYHAIINSMIYTNAPKNVVESIKEIHL